jgi:hypothetical protein
MQKRRRKMSSRKDSPYSYQDCFKAWKKRFDETYSIEKAEIARSIELEKKDCNKDLYLVLYDRTEKEYLRKAGIV